jgi:steroid delta-isomerase-like uncharacterized protein
MSIIDDRELVHRYMSADAKEVAKSVAASGRDEYHAPEFKFHFAGKDTNLEQYMQVMGTIVSAFPDAKYSSDDIIGEGDKVVSRYHFTGTHKGTYQGVPASGKKVNLEGIAIFRLSNGKLVEMWAVNDSLGMMQQIGAIPAAPPPK